MKALRLVLFCVFSLVLPAQADGLWPFGNDNTEEPSKEGNAITRVINQALDLIGLNYKYGADKPEHGGLDCSGLVKYVFDQTLNIALPHNALAMSRLGQQISRADLKPGDLVFFNTLRRSFSHVGIYIGDGKFVHAPRSGQKVQVVDMNAKYWDSRFEGARRIVGASAASATPSE